jgi:hypothetical protein
VLEATRVKGISIFTDSIISDEWPAMEQGRQSDKTWAYTTEFWECVVAIEPQSDRESNLHEAILGATQNMAEHRRARLAAAATGMSPFLWGVIIFGGSVTVLFTYFFTTKMGPLHNLMTALVAVSLALNIWLLAAYNAPFSGELKIQPVLLQTSRERIFSVPDTPSRFLRAPGGSAHTTPTQK